MASKLRAPSNGRRSATNPPIRGGHSGIQTDNAVFFEFTTIFWLLLVFMISVLIMAIRCAGRILRELRKPAEGKSQKELPPHIPDSKKRPYEYDDLNRDSLNTMLLVIKKKPTPFQEIPDQTASSAARLFQYTDLPTPRHIRLLKRVETGNSDNMVFEVVCVLLEEVVEDFVAISYCWGTDDPSKLLPLLDGSHICVTANVEALLTHIFTTDHEYIWLDAICINQSNTFEKNDQVRMMKEIYAAARRVSVWLGHGMPEVIRGDRDHGNDNDSDSDTTTDTSSDSDNARDKGSEGDGNGNSDEHGGRDNDGDGASNIVVCYENEEKEEDVKDHNHEHDEEAKFFQEFYGEVAGGAEGKQDLDLEVFFRGCLKLQGATRSPWWRRIWVVQEFSYARSIWFHYGRLVFSLAFLNRWFDEISRHEGKWLYIEEEPEKGPSNKGRSIINRQLLLAVLQGARVSVLVDGESELPSLGEMYARLYPYKATDPRDRIFALLSLVDGASYGRCILPDYGSKTRDVFVHAMAAITCNKLDFACLGFAGLAAPPTNCDASKDDSQALPSWVPDFSAFNIAIAANLSACVGFYNAATSRRPVLAKKEAICLANKASAPANDPEYDYYGVDHGVPCPAQTHKKPRCPAEHHDTLIVHSAMVDTVVCCGVEFSDANPETSFGAWDTIKSGLDFFDDSLRMIQNLGAYPTREKPEEVLVRTLLANNASNFLKPKKPDGSLGPEFKEFLRALRAEADAGRGEESLVSKSSENPYNVLERLKAFTETVPATMAGFRRKLFSTKRGYIGLALNGVMVGDEVRLINGAGVPFITRNCPTVADNDGSIVRQLVCEAYIHGIMDGEASSFENVEEGLLVLV